MNVTATTAKKLLTKLASEKRANAEQTFCDYLMAKEATSGPADAVSLRAIRYAVKSGAAIVPATAAALPYLNKAGASKVALQLCKEASGYKRAMSESFLGKPSAAAEKLKG